MHVFQFMCKCMALIKVMFKVIQGHCVGVHTTSCSRFTETMPPFCTVLESELFVKSQIFPTPAWRWPIEFHHVLLHQPSAIMHCWFRDDTQKGKKVKDVHLCYWGLEPWVEVTGNIYWRHVQCVINTEESNCNKKTLSHQKNKPIFCSPSNTRIPVGVRPRLYSLPSRPWTDSSSSSSSSSPSANCNNNSSGDETANVNFLRRYRKRTSKYQKREPTSFNKLDDS